MPESQHRPLGMPGSSWPISSIMDAKLMEWGCPWGLGPPVPVGSERPGHTASESAAVSKVSSGTTKSRAMAVLEVWLRNLPVTFGYLVLPRFCIIWESLFIFLVTRLSVLSLGTLIIFCCCYLLFITFYPQITTILNSWSSLSSCAPDLRSLLPALQPGYPLGLCAG